MFDWTSFGTGFAKAASENFAKEEEDARALGAANVKSMYENYASVVKENRTLSNDIKEKINIVKGFAPDATDDQLVALAQDRGILDMLSTRLKDKDFDPLGFNINDFVKVADPSGSALSAEDRINELFTIPSAVNDASRAFKSLTPEGEVKESPGFLSYFDPVGLAKRGGEKEARASAEKTAAALGIPLEKLQGAMGYKRDIKPSGAEYSLVELKPSKTLDQSLDDAAVKLAAAQKDGDPKKIEMAKANLSNFKAVKDTLSDDQQQWANNVARLKGLQIKGTPAQKQAATEELDAIFAAERKAKQAVLLPKEERENMLADLATKANSEDPKVSGPALAQLIKEASTEGKVAEAKQTKVQKRENYLADIDLKARTGTPEDKEIAKAKLVEMAKLDKLIADNKLGDVQQREAYLVRLKNQAKDPDPAIATPALAELKLVSAIDATIKEAGNTSVEKLAATKAQLVIDTANGDKDAEAKLQAFFAVEKMEADAKQGAAAKRTSLIAQLKMDVAAGKPGAREELDRQEAVDIAAKKAEAEATKGAAQKRADRLAELATAAAAGNAEARAEFNREKAVDDEAKKAEAEAIKGDAQKRTDRLAKLQTDAANGVPGAQEEYNREAAVDNAAKAAEAEATKGDAQRRKDEMAALQRRVDNGDMSAKPQLDRMIALDTAAKEKEREALETDVSKRNNRIASYQTIITTSKDPAAVKEARKQMALEIKLMKEEAAAKYVPPAEKEKALPGLGALNAFVGSAVGQAVLNKHGNLSKDMAIVEKQGEGGVTYKEYDYIGDDPALRKQIADTKAAAAKKALSVYMDNNGKPLDRNVQAVLNSWTGSAAAPERTETGTGGGRGLGSRGVSNTTTTGSGASTVVIVTDKEGKQFKFEGADAVRRATGFKEAKGLKQ